MRLLRLTAGAAGAGLLMGACTHMGGGHKAVGAAALFGAIDAAALALVVWCGVRGRRTEGDRAPDDVPAGPAVRALATPPWSRQPMGASPTA
jgi:hypothetical protein